jgi:hypothetical protein
MRKLTYILLATLLALPNLVYAEFSADDLPAASTWYFHVDFKEMRKSEAGAAIYEWLDTEVFDEIRDEIGVDFDQELDQITAYAAEGSAPAIMLYGPISQDTKDKLLAAAAAAGKGDFQQTKAGGKLYYSIGGYGDEVAEQKIDLDAFEDQIHFSFALKDRILLTPSAGQMQEMLANGGRIAGSKATKDALFVLTAESTLMQAGANAKALGENGDWDSNILQNTKQLALMIADSGGMIAFDAQLEATEPDMADSLASIARGLVSLASFSDEVEPEIAAMLRGVKIDVKDSWLKLSMAVDAEAFVSMLED